MQANITLSEMKKIAHVVESDPVLKALTTKTNTEIETWVDNNVTNVDEVKFVIKKLLIIQKYIINRVLKGSN